MASNETVIIVVQPQTQLGPRKKLPNTNNKVCAVLCSEECFGALHWRNQKVTPSMHSTEEPPPQNKAQLHLKDKGRQCSQYGLRRQMV